MLETITAHTDDIAALMTLEMGKVIAESKGEVKYGAEFFRGFAEEAVRIDGRYTQSPAGTGRIIVTAAVIMVVAFGGFAMGTDIGMKEFGFGLAAAVAIDALLIRCLIVPAVLAMAGERTWRRRRREAVTA